MRIHTFIESLDLSLDETYRGNCPVCHGKNTFTATKEHGNLLWNCYKLGCNASGSKQVNLTVEEIKQIREQKNSTNVPESYEDLMYQTFDRPPYLTAVTQERADVRTFMTKWQIAPSDVLFDIRQDRVVFPVQTPDKVLVDAVGRSLNGRQPKWLRYGNSPVPYTYGEGKIAVVVEDAISAYKIGVNFRHMCTGVALLGTQLTGFHKWFIGNYYDFVIVALDPDARNKTVKLVKELRTVVERVYGLNVKDDLKYMRSEDIEALLERINDSL